MAKRLENKRMEAFISDILPGAAVKFTWSGSIKGCWRVYKSNAKWTEELIAAFTEKGFSDFDGQPLRAYSNNGVSWVSVWLRGHYELLDGVTPPKTATQVVYK